MRKISLEDALILSAAKTARRIVHWLPLETSLAIGRFFGRVIYGFNKRKSVAFQNLRAAFGPEKSPEEMKGIAKRSFESMVMAIIELLRIPDIDRSHIDKHVRILGTEKFQDCLDRKQGLIFLTAHFGNWEMLNVAASLLGYPMVALARVQKHPRSDAFLNSLRTSKGSQIIHKGMPVREILHSLKKGKIVGILSDQDGGRSGVFVNFFGRESSTPSGAATFAIRTGSPIFPVFIFREGAVNHRVEVEGPLRMPAPDASAEEGERMILQQFAEILEQKIRKAPDQWLWAHRRWKSTPDRSVVVLSDGKQGHLNQSLAVLEAYKEERLKKGCRPEHMHSKIVEIKYKTETREKFLRALAIALGGRLPFKMALLKWALSEDCHREILSSYADTVISCGSSLAPVNLLVKHLNGAKSVVVMKPPFSTARFDAVIAPQHDKLAPSKRVFVTQTSPSLISGAYLQSHAERFSGNLNGVNGSRRIGLLVGGDTPELKFSKTHFENFISRLGSYSTRAGCVVLATSSRRTPAWADEVLKQNFKNKPACPLLIIANESNPPGAVGGILGLSDVIVVSGESMSMVSEAVASGKPVCVFTPGDPARLKAKHRSFLANLESRNMIVRADSETLEKILEKASDLGGSLEAVLKDREILSEAMKRVAS